MDKAILWLQGKKSYIVAGLWFLSYLAYTVELVDMDFVTRVKDLALPLLGITFAAKINRSL